MLELRHMALRSFDRVGNRSRRAHRARGRAYAQLGRWEETAADVSKAIDLGPRDGSLWLNRGDAYSELSRWDGAYADYWKAFEFGARHGKSMALQRLAHVRLATNEIGGYREACAALLGLIEQEDQPTEVDVVARICVLVPDAVADREAAVRLAEKAVNAKTTPSVRHSYLGTLGAATYRAGRYEEAVRHLDEGVKAGGKGGDALDWIFLAMAHQRLGHTGESRRWMDKAISWIDSSTKDKPKDDTFGARIDWQTWLALQVLRREAEALLKGSQAEAPRHKP